MIELIILAVLILLNGLFTMSEIALVSARKSRLEAEADKGDRNARVALELANRPELFLSAAQIGITLISILTGFYSAEKFNVYLQPLIEKIGFLEHYAKTISTVIIVAVVTFLSIIFGELLPKRIGLLQAEQIAKIMAQPMKTFARITHPIVWLLNSVSRLFFRFFNIRLQKDTK